MRRFAIRFFFKLVAYILAIAPVGNCGAPLSYDSALVQSHALRWNNAVSAAIARSRALVDSTLGFVVTIPYTVFIAENDSEFAALTNNSAPDWGGAVAIPSLRRIVVKSPDMAPSEKSLAQLIAHEYAHLALHDFIGRPPPRFLDEGFAMFIATEWQFEDAITVGSASLFNNLIPLYHIERINSFDASAARLAYAESYLAFRHLLEYYGSESARAVVARIRDGEGVNAALHQTIGVDLAGFQKEVFDDISHRYSPFSVIMNSNIFWGALALVVVIGFILARVRRRSRYREWEKRERIESTDFDYGDPKAPEKEDDEDHPWR